MAMSKVVMGAAIKSAIDAYVATIPEPQGENLNRTDLMEALAQGIIDGIATAQIDIKLAFIPGVPVPTDGGAALKTAWSIQPALTGAIS